MELVLKRLIKTEKSTIGELSINGSFECYIKKLKQCQEN